MRLAQYSDIFKMAALGTALTAGSIVQAGVSSTRQGQARAYAAPLSPASVPLARDNGYGVPSYMIEKAWSTAMGVPYTGAFPQQCLLRRAVDGRPLDKGLIVIDPGHGVDIDNGSGPVLDFGAKHVPEGLHETDVIDRLSLAVARELNALGYQVAFTRNPGEKLPFTGGHRETLAVRARFAHALHEEMAKAYLFAMPQGFSFISIHVNKAPTRTANGASIHILPNAEDVRPDGSGALARALQAGYDVDGTTVRQGRGDTPTSIVPNRFAVLSTFNALIPDRANAQVYSAALIETGFMSNASDAAALRRIRDKPETAAKMIAKAIDTHRSGLPAQFRYSWPGNWLETAFPGTAALAEAASRPAGAGNHPAPRAL